MTRTRKYLLVGIVAAAAIAGVAFLNVSSRAAAAGRVAAVPAPDILAPGLVESTGEKVELAFETSGRVVEVSVHEGDHVVAGQLLARLDDSLARARVARAQAALASAEASRDLALHGARPEEISSARSEAEAARAQADERTRAHHRASRLSDQNAISAAALDVDASLAEAAEARASAADARYQMTVKGTRAELRREAIAQVAAAAAELEQAKVLRAQTELHAVKDGVVLRRFIEPGEQVTTTPLVVALTIADLEHLQVRAEVDEADICRVTTGLAGFATADGFGGRHFSGHIVRVTSELGRKRVRTDDPRARLDTRVLEAIFTLDQPERIPLGLQMNVHFGSAPTSACL